MAPGSRHGRSAHQLKIRAPDGIRDRLKGAADLNGRSMNAEIVRRLEASLRFTPPNTFAEKDGSASAPTLPSHGSNNSRQENAVNKKHITTAPRAGATAVAEIRRMCPVAALTDRFASARAAYRDADERRVKGVRTGPEANRADRQCQHILDEEYAVKAMIANTQASSLEGAAIQIAEIASYIETIWEAVPDRRDSDDHASYRAAFRLIYSALHAIESQLQVPLADLVDPEVVDTGLDPWRFLQRSEEPSTAADGSCGPLDREAA